MYQKFGKRLFDICLALSVLVATSPLMLVVAFLLLAGQGRPVFFRQQRPGRHEKPFYMVKFRTMNNERDSRGELCADAERLTAVGSFLRASSLDELPELWNVLRGDMSLVGPRPLLMEYLPKYSERQARRHEVRPGITGWAQVKGRQSIPFSQRLEYDVWYVENLSLAVDLRILASTVLQVFQSRGVILGQDVAEVDDIGLSDSDFVAKQELKKT